MTVLVNSSWSAENSSESDASPQVARSSERTLPVGWELVQLSTVAQLESGHTPSRRHPEYWGGDISWLSLHDTDMLDGAEVQKTSQGITQKGIDNSSARVLPKGTVVFSRTATVGKATVLGREMATSQDFACYICGPRVHNHFLVYLFRHMAPEWRRYMAGSTHNTVYMPVFRALQVPLPPRPEQEAIAKALGDTDDHIEALERLLEKKRLIKQGAMQELLSGRRRLPGSQGDWKVVPLGSLFLFKNGLNKSKSYFGYGTPIINYMDVFSRSGLRAADVKGSVDVSEREIESFSAKRGDVFFTRTSETLSEIGVASVLMEDIENSVFSGFLLRARPVDNEVDIEFKRYCFASEFVRRQIVSKGTYTTRALTNGRVLSTVLLRLPPTKAEQQAIAQVLSNMDEEIEALEFRLEKARQIKQGMTQDLLTGKVRLV